MDAGRARRLAGDIGFGAVSAGALAFQASQIAAIWGGGYWRLGLAAGTAVGVITLMRRRDRARAAFAGLAVAMAAVWIAWWAGLPAEPNPAMALGLSVLVASAVRTLPLRSAAAVGAAGAAVAAGGLAAALTSASAEAVAQLNCAGWLAALAAGLGLRLLDARNRALTEKARRDVRMELARELHDVVAHHIAGIVLLAQAAPIAARRDPAAADASFAEIEAVGTEALDATRRVVGLLRDTDDTQPFTSGLESLRDLVERFSGRGPAVRLRLPGGEAEWAPEVASTVYRVVQESLTNVARHAPHAASVLVSVEQDGASVAVEVADDAPPTRAGGHSRRGGYGLVGMRERVEALGGRVQAGPRPGGGWSVRATLPLPARSGR
ncbi:signal transduction histidine kinase [Streptomonospora nanhaiensis]|uniref:histidine kinase n=1 Tax=Streptomonospora nanhaiensis TaxID=1323731 RepID=A0A853BLN7_9ACTN|nr:histidine kinase [Streptomonospora nanhaiensis]NYI96479.1 signal transduction histidine kinase [Streptomonospora nanhaiensis]